MSEPTFTPPALTERQRKMISYALYRLMHDAYGFSAMHAQKGVHSDRDRATAFLKDAKDAEELRKLFKKEGE